MDLYNLQILTTYPPRTKPLGCVILTSSTRLFVQDSKSAAIISTIWIDFGNLTSKGFETFSNWQCYIDLHATTHVSFLSETISHLWVLSLLVKSLETVIDSSAWILYQISWPEAIYRNLDSIQQYRWFWVYCLSRPVHQRDKSRRNHISMALDVLSQNHITHVFLELVHLIRQDME